MNLLTSPDVETYRPPALRHESFAAWCAPIFTALTVIGFLGLARFYHPVAASVPDHVLAAFYQRHHLAIEIGMSLFGLATAFLTLFTIELTIVLWRREGTPLMSLGQLLGGFGVVMLIFISCCLWIGAAYRAGAAGADVTVALNDASWFGFLVGWVILAIQMVCTGVAGLSDRGPDPLAPRWASWLSIVGAVALATANGCAFTKGGVLGWNGVLGYYVPMVIWCVWLNGYAYLVHRDVRRRRARREPLLAVEPLAPLEPTPSHVGAG
jgi:hypothetical protein